jgi:hypothetical protein
VALAGGAAASLIVAGAVVLGTWGLAVLVDEFDRLREEEFGDWPCLPTEAKAAAPRISQGLGGSRKGRRPEPTGHASHGHDKGGL